MRSPLKSPHSNFPARTCAIDTFFVVINGAIREILKTTQIGRYALFSARAHAFLALICYLQCKIFGRSEQANGCVIQ